MCLLHYKATVFPTLDNVLQMWAVSHKVFIYWRGRNDLVLITEIAGLLPYYWCCTTLATMIFLLLSNNTLGRGPGWIYLTLNPALSKRGWRGVSLVGSYFVCKYKSPALTGNPSAALCCSCSFPKLTSLPWCLDNRMVTIYKTTSSLFLHKTTQP